jgi:signal peptidase I
MSLNWWQYLLLIEFASSVYLFKFFQLAGKEAWKSFIPVYKTIILMEITGRSKWQSLLFFVPVVNHVMWVVSAYELLHVFNKRTWTDILLTVVTFGLWLGIMPFRESLNYQGEPDLPAMKKQLGEFIPSALFAIVAATVIRTFSFEAYTIPTSSMEESLMVGDFLFVSKLHYGCRLPMTPFTLPLLHADIPFFGGKTYREIVKFPYVRLPKIQAVKRGEAVVFNTPEDVSDPIDKRRNYVKRCVGIPGDSLEIKGAQVYINGEKSGFPERANPQFNYYVRTNGIGFNRKQLKKEFDINFLTNEEMRRNNDYGDMQAISNNEYIVSVSEKALDGFKQLSNVSEIIPLNVPKDAEEMDADLPEILKRYYQREMGKSRYLFPNDLDIHKEADYQFSIDNYGPIYLPKEGDKMELNDANFTFYQRTINEFDGHILEKREDGFYVDDEKADSYTWKQSYYWMMGDNRYNSADSRFFGFVPENHIVGKPSFIWMSYDKYAEGANKIRTERVFTTVHGEGKRFSFFWPFVILVFGYSFWSRRRKSKKEAA